MKHHVMDITLVVFDKHVIDRSRGIKWTWQQCSRLFEMGIRSIEDIKAFPMEEIEKIKFSMPEIYGRLKENLQ